MRRTKISLVNWRDVTTTVFLDLSTRAQKNAIKSNKIKNNAACQSNAY